ncbi:hypothetical protein GQ54DRAFT_214608 [Martensiomyces pterosporus]|nr:hypothetical protein GQ54DRAFT_214608 [Martensiomyces pterosporus]
MGDRAALDELFQTSHLLNNYPQVWVGDFNSRLRTSTQQNEHNQRGWMLRETIRAENLTVINHEHHANVPTLYTPNGSSTVDLVLTTQTAAHLVFNFCVIPTNAPESTETASAIRLDHCDEWASEAR